MAFELLRKQFELYDENKLEKNEIFFNSNISLRNISFSYEGTEKKILDSINLDIYKGDTIGFIGDSGSGKSTLVDLIIGLLKPIAGKILVDGKPINTKSSNWLNHFGYVQQNIYLIDDSLKMNIAFGELDHDIDTSLLTNAIKNSELDELVNALPNGLDTNVGEGVKLSGGQKQRIAIARALYRNPEILIFDEATSALDTNTEDKVMLSINKLKENLL